MTIPDTVPLVSPPDEMERDCFALDHSVHNHCENSVILDSILLPVDNVTFFPLIGTLLVFFSLFLMCIYVIIL